MSRRSVKIVAPLLAALVALLLGYLATGTSSAAETTPVPTAPATQPAGEGANGTTKPPGRLGGTVILRPGKPGHGCTACV